MVVFLLQLNDIKCSNVSFKAQLLCVIRYNSLVDPDFCQC